MRGLNIHTKKAHGSLDSNKNEAIAEVSDVNKNETNVCLGCNKTFTTKSGLTRHTKTCQPDTLSLNEYKCSTCEASYTYKKNLTRHLKTCHGKTSWKNWQFKGYIVKVIEIKHFLIPFIAKYWLVSFIYLNRIKLSIRIMWHAAFYMVEDGAISAPTLPRVMRCVLLHPPTCKTLHITSSWSWKICSVDILLPKGWK